MEWMLWDIGLIRKSGASYTQRHIFVTITLKEVCAYLTNGVEGIFPILNVVITFLLSCPDE